MDPISAIAKAVGDIVGGALSLAESKRNREATMFAAQQAAQTAIYNTDGALIQSLTSDDVATKTRNYIIAALVIGVIVTVIMVVYYMFKK